MIITIIVHPLPEFLKDGSDIVLFSIFMVISARILFPSLGLTTHNWQTYTILTSVYMGGT